MGNSLTAEEPKITVLTLCYNTGQYVIEALECVKNQTYNNIELIIIDDKSSDNSVELIENWIIRNNYKCSFIKNTVNLGIPGVFNKALGIATGKYLTWISDDLWENNRILDTVKIFETVPETVGIMFGKMNMINSIGTPLYEINPINIIANFKCYPEDKIILNPDNYTIINGEDIRKTLFYKSCILAPSVTVRRTIYEKVGAYDETITVEDMDCWFKASHFFDFVFVPKSMAQYRVHETNFTSGLNESYIKSLITVLNKNKLNNSRNNGIIKKHIREEAYRIGINLSKKKMQLKAWKYFFKYYLPNFQLSSSCLKETLKLLQSILFTNF
jgi:glycosyltransferase involved in cell wall biosynthesis